MPTADASNPIEAVRARLDGPNVPLLRQTMDAILAHPELHDQSWWATQTDCGTAYCFAGWACHLSGVTQPSHSVWTNDGRTLGRAATQLLCLDDRTALQLFAADNSTADLKHYVDQIAEHGRIVEPIKSDEVPF